MDRIRRDPKGKQNHRNLQFQSLVFLSLELTPCKQSKPKIYLLDNCWDALKPSTHHRAGQQNIRMSTCITCYLTRKDTSREWYHIPAFLPTLRQLRWFSSKRWKFYWNLSPPSTSWPAKSRGEMQFGVHCQYHPTFLQRTSLDKDSPSLSLDNLIVAISQTST